MDRSVVSPVRDVRSLSLDRPSIVVIGKFDGMHIGHCGIFAEGVRRRARLQEQPDVADALLVAITFDPLPTVYFNPDGGLKMLSSPEERVLLARQQGADHCVVQTFDRHTAELTAEGFVGLLVRHLRMTELVIGEDFALGRNRTGTPGTLRELGRTLGFDVTTVPDVRRDGAVVRSGTIRDLLQRGDVERTAQHLGRSPFVAGIVVEGVKLARKLGFPTANLQPIPDRLYPKTGVYATRSWVPHPVRAYSSVTNIGYRPTFDGTEFRVESHLLDFPPEGEDGNLYEQQIAVEFVSRLRDETRFSDVEELCRQVQCDIGAARARLAGTAPTPEQAVLLRDLIRYLNR
ncbi:MAG: riboflavin biosynthesis protein RibF [Caldilineaceae bacterium SB0665_bin_21]|nr:riboflavin biosynthesis protein RibF [Caldilineaceae bacterium SB0665_bin_21]MYA05694.1 riboflavin biosynthesis protein RibF [Caldilineaceae bacterium SB0664_bin_22]MYC64470.1 riboflavin biosynthesis protein RibF [Caldilineaceae bacterium SB0661_bin_34]